MKKAIILMITVFTINGFSAQVLNNKVGSFLTNKEIKIESTVINLLSITASIPKKSPVIIIYIIFLFIHNTLSNLYFLIFYI